jgi:hypothetical protein
MFRAFLPRVRIADQLRGNADPHQENRSGTYQHRPAHPVRAGAVIGKAKAATPASSGRASSSATHDLTAWAHD